MNCICLFVLFRCSSSRSRRNLEATINLKPELVGNKQQQIISRRIGREQGDGEEESAKDIQPETFINVFKDIFHYHILLRSLAEALCVCLVRSRMRNSFMKILYGEINFAYSPRY